LLSVRVFTSQPFIGLPSQSAQPELHDATWHMPPAEHIPVAFAGAHAKPQPPQCERVFSACSQPSL
jgi:hypothetical protein